MSSPTQACHFFPLGAAPLADRSLLLSAQRMGRQGKGSPVTACSGHKGGPIIAAKIRNGRLCGTEVEESVGRRQQALPASAVNCLTSPHSAACRCSV